MNSSWRDISLRFAIVVTAVTILSSTLPTQPVQAADITVRSLTLQAGADDGGSAPGGVVDHFFQFTVPTTGTDIGSIKFEYCTTASGTCTVPTGLDTTSATLGSEAGLTGWTLVSDPDGTPAGVNGSPYLTRGAAAAPSAGTLEYQLQSVTNPTTANEAFFVRISTYASSDTTGTPVDDGTVAASTATQIEISGTMPESLVFCTGADIDVTNGIPDCSTATPGNIEFDQLFSPTDTATALSEMAASTNASGGYSITVNGSTLTSGSNTVEALDTATISTVGTGQFGMNLKANTAPTIGAEVAPLPNGDDIRGQSAAGYNTVDTFKFTSGDVIAASDNNGVGPTNIQIFTSSYIVNVPGSQPAGTYTSTLTYICTATF